MYQISQDVQNALASGACGLRLTGGGQTWEVRSARLVSQCCGGEHITIGSVCAAGLTASVVGQAPPTESSVTLEAVVETGSETVYLPLGTFTVTDSASGEGAGEITAYDAAYHALQAEYVPAASPATALAVLGEIASQCALTLGDTTGLVDQTVTGDLTGYTCRDMTGYMAALLGCNAFIDRTGRLSLRWFTDTGRSITADDYYAGSLSLNGTQALVGLRMTKKTTVSTTDADGITAETEQTVTYSAGTGTGAVLEVENPFAAQSITNAVWENISALGAHRTGSCTVFGGLTLEPGDVVHLTDTAGNVCLFPITAVTLELDGGCRATLSAAGDGDTDAGTQGAVGRLLSKIEADIGAFKELTSENFAAAEAKVNNLYADEAWVDRLFGQHIEAKSLDVGGASRFTGVIDASSAEIGGVKIGPIDGDYSREVVLPCQRNQPPGPYPWAAYAQRVTWPAHSVGLRLVSIGIQVTASAPRTQRPRFTLNIGTSTTSVDFDAEALGIDYGQEVRVAVSPSDVFYSVEAMDLTLTFHIAMTGDQVALRFYYGNLGRIVVPENAVVQGKLLVSDLTMVLSAVTVTKRSFCPSYVTNASKRLAMNFPLSRPLASGATITCTDLSIAVFLPAGGCPYALSGSTYTQLGSSFVKVWENGASKRSGEVTGVACENYGESIRVNVSFANTLRVNAGSTVVANYSTPTVVAEATFHIV